MSRLKLSDAQRRQWARDGYLIVPGALTSHDLDRCTNALDKLYAQHVGSRKDGAQMVGMNRRNIFQDNDVFIDLIDHQGTFGLVLDLMGSYIGCSVAQATMRRLDPDSKGYIHPDGGEALEQIRVTETSLPLQVKIQYFLTDLPEPNMGNFTVFPGSHLRPWPKERLPAGPQTPGAVPLCVAAGDAVIFPHSLWHGPGPNLSGRVRKTLIYRYHQLFMHPWDFEQASPTTLARCTPRQRRLLGDVGDWSPGTYYRKPNPQDQESLMRAG